MGEPDALCFLNHQLLSRGSLRSSKGSEDPGDRGWILNKIGDGCVLSGYMPNSHLYTQIVAIKLRRSGWSRIMAHLREYRLSILSISYYFKAEIRTIWEPGKKECPGGTPSRTPAQVLYGRTFLLTDHLRVWLLEPGWYWDYWERRRLFEGGAGRRISLNRL